MSSTQSDFSSVPSNGFPLRVLSPTVAFYIRKLIRRNFDQLKLLASGTPILAEGWGDLDRILSALHGNNMHVIQQSIDQLEHLARAHQVLSSQGTMYPDELRETEKGIFSLLGYELKHRTDRGNILIDPTRLPATYTLRLSPSRTNAK